jgi:lipopolysaccharide biosynthesis regulator YciM
LRDVLVDTGAWARAAEVQERIVQLKPDDANERNRLIGVRYETAVRLPREERSAALSAIAAGGDDFVPAILERARGFAEAGDSSRAGKVLEKALRRRANGALLDEIERLTTPDDTARVAKLYVKLVETFPSSAALRARAARYLTNCGRSEQAAELLRGADADGAPPAAIDAARVVLYESRGQSSEAAQAAKRLVEREDRLYALWRCGGCRAVADTWSARCPTCRAWGLIDNL